MRNIWSGSTLWARFSFSNWLSHWRGQCNEGTNSRCWSWYNLWESQGNAHTHTHTSAFVCSSVNTSWFSPQSQSKTLYLLCNFQPRHRKYLVMCMKLSLSHQNFVWQFKDAGWVDNTYGEIYEICVCISLKTHSQNCQYFFIVKILGSVHMRCVGTRPVQGAKGTSFHICTVH